jgi:hypothetical protein
MIFIRGNVEIVNKEEVSTTAIKSTPKIKDDRRSARSYITPNTEIATPFAFINRSE